MQDFLLGIYNKKDSNILYKYSKKQVSWGELIDKRGEACYNLSI